MVGKTALVYIMIMIISKTQIVKKPSALYKEHDGRWGSGLIYMYKNQIKQKSYTESLSLSHTHTHAHTNTPHTSN